MQFSFTEEQTQFRGEIRKFLERHSPTSEIRRVMETPEGYDASVWRGLSADLGLTGIHIPETYGGAGFGFVELAIAAEEMGRSLLCAPYFSSVALAANAIMNGASEGFKEQGLPALANGEEIATLAVAEANGRWDPAGLAMVATRIDGRFRLSGVKKFVLDGHVADRIIVAARASGTTGEAGISLFALPGDSPGLRRRPLSTIDATRKQAELVFDNVDVQLISEPGSAGAALARTMEQACIILANEMVGGAQALLDSAVEYARLRMQFGRPIGSFQAIKHKCADLLLRVELARAAAYQAAAALADADPETTALASLAKAVAAETYSGVAAECIQIHGGIGFTWDHDTQLWFKRAKSSEVLFGGPAYHRERYLQKAMG